MTDLELAEEIERLVTLSAKATQGKWSSEDGYLIGYPPKSRPNGEGITQFHCAIDPNFPRSHADGEFVATLVNWFRANIAALRRWPEHAIAEREGYPGPTVPWGDGRPPSGEMVMVPREPTDAIVWAICEHSDAPIDRERCLRCPAKEPTYYGEGTRGCRALAEDQFRAALSAAEAEGRKS